MALTGLLHAFAADPALRRALDFAREEHPEAVDVTAPGGTRPALAAALAGVRPLLVVTATGREADDLVAGLASFVDPDDVALFPAWETLPHERLSPRSDTVGRRLAVLRRLTHPAVGTDAAPGTGPARIVVAPVRAVLQPVVSGLGDLEPVALRRGESRPLDEVSAALSAAAYSRVDMVERRGEFAVRGGILDVFPPTDPRPSRIEFFGDEVDEIRHFAVADQRSLAPTADDPAPDSVWAPPCREILLTDEVRARARALVPRLPGAAEMLERIAAGHAVEGMESLAPALVDSMVPLVRLLDPATLVLACDPERIRRRASDLVSTSQEFLEAAWSSAAAGAETPLDLSASSFASLADTRAEAASAGLAWWTVTPFGADEELAEEAGDTRVLALGARDPRSYHGDVPAILTDVKGHLGEGWRVVMVTGGPGPLSRLGSVLAEHDVPARVVASLDETPEPGVVLLTCARAGNGFAADGLRLLLLTEADVFGKTSRSGGTGDMRRLPSRRRNMVDPLQLRPGDYVVHDQHGVGRFVEMIQRTVGSGPNRTTREYLVIEYASAKRGQPGDRLYVPSDALDQVTRYVGGDEPKVNKLGGADWAKTKSRARKAVKQIAGELVRLYAARTTAKGFAFSPDTPWQRELEEAFPYVETPDQLTSIDEVKADMEKPLPMDRLISGDVGYGKTEIAVRAAFKAVQDGKQVAVLVPTTLLVQQHHETFTERFSGFPVTVRALSRFQNASESAETTRGLAEGAVDVVIGTHRLLTGEVRFKDLGLVIVDEEQRFGVEHKETLKQLRANVDVLSMSATPIPRTLEMAVTGIREMSTLATPPEERHPVLTYVGPYDNRQVAAAVRRELLREGQVFFIHNRVRDIDATAAHLRELVPEARVEVAHGQMNEGQLEQVIVDFWEKRFDVLVCTTIVETGLDISNANTLIVDRADHFGLSQLHQLRGRVGRGRERAYSYFLYPGDKPLTETAHDRLETIAAHTDLGAGMQVALKDLEIRGAGNLLGGEQSGHIEGVGFDLYIRMVGEAVAEYKGDGAVERREVKIELPVDAHLPHEYIAEERLRLEAYQKLANADSDAAVDEVMAELRDRYGEPPEAVRNLAAVARFRAFARERGLTDVAAVGRNVRFAPVDLRDSQVMRLKRLYPGATMKPAVRQILVPFPTTARIGGRPLRGVALLDWARELLGAVLDPQPQTVPTA